MSNAEVAISRAEIIEAADSIEALPASVSRLLEVVSDDNFSAQAIVEVVQYDAALAGDVLARANSAMSGATRKIGELRQATARLGSAAVVEIALRRAMRDRLSAALPSYGLGPNELWRHGLTASISADSVRKAATAAIPPMIATAALVHDVGKMVIAGVLPESLVDALLIAAETDSISLDEAERRVLGLDHGEVSGVVVRAWGLPVSVQVALTQHHQAATGDPFTHALILADHVAHAVDAMGAGELQAELVDEQVAALLRDCGDSLTACGIDPSKLAGVIESSTEATREILATLSN